MWQSKPPAGIQLNRNHSLSQGLVGCWLFNEGAGTIVNDLSGNNNTGTLTNMIPSATSGWTGGIHGTALNFDGVNDYISAGNNVTITGPYSIEGWVKIPTNPGSADRALMSLNTTPGGFPRFSPHFWTSNRPLIYLNDINYKYGTTNLANNNWHNIVFIVMGTNATDILNAKIYVDGVEEVYGETVSTGLPVAPSGKAWIGTNSFNGSLDEVRIYNRALSAQEVQQLYINPYAMFLSPQERIRKYYSQ